MVKQLIALAVAGVFAFGIVGPVLAASVEGTISAVADEGASVAVKDKDGKEVKVRISSSSTELTKGGKQIGRKDLKVGNKVKVTYDEKDSRMTASKFEVQ